MLPNNGEEFWLLYDRSKRQYISTLNTYNDYVWARQPNGSIQRTSNGRKVTIRHSRFISEARGFDSEDIAKRAFIRLVEIHPEYINKIDIKKVVVKLTRPKGSAALNILTASEKAKIAKYMDPRDIVKLKQDGVL